ncbi:MAG TPA: EamA family transporter [Opitutaceae bacterium]|nr:EamA family transporter [Opitutaceae bacterium]
MNWLVWSLLSAFFAGLTAVLAKRGVSGLDSNLATAVRTTVVLVFAWLVAFVAADPGQLRHVQKQTWIFLVLSGLATGLSWLCYFRALQMGVVAKVASVDKLGVVFAIILAAVWLGEPLTWRTGAGAALIVAGAIVLAVR